MPRNEKERWTVRRSLAYFVHADRDVVVNRPLFYQDGVEKETKLNYTDKPITAYEHARQKWDKSY